ncbi:MAG: cytochrome d ubiquinol oxidase subunit II [Verrucomicrobiota bacterium JB025]
MFSDLNAIWFVLVGVLFGGYAMLDGFDLGVGALMPFVKKDHDRRILYNSIGPVWDGNEVWLVTGGGALFAAFPEVYATVFSGFYLAFIGLLFMLIFRAVAIEFRSKEPWGWWRRMWDWSFTVGSVGASFLIGVAMGNIVRGVPLDARHEYAGGFFDLLNPYSLMMGVTTVALFMMHGSIYLHMKTEGDLQQQVRGWISPLIILFIVCYSVFNLATLLYVPHITDVLRDQPLLFAVVVFLVLAIANIPREIHHGRDARAFLSSCATMLLLMSLFGMGMFPNMVYSLPNPENSLTAYNASSSQKTLRIMLIIAAIGVPIVLAYTVAIYTIFRGKVKLGKDSY